MMSSTAVPLALGGVERSPHASRPGLRAYTMFPIQDLDVYKMYKLHESKAWVSDELDFSPDAKAYLTMPDRYREIYRQFLGFFAPGDGIVSAQISTYLSKAKTYEELAFMTMQMKSEITHAETYGRAIVEVLPDAEQEEVFSEIERLPCVKAKADFVEEGMYAEGLSDGARYFYGALAEGVFFAGLFSLVFFFRRVNCMKVFRTANEFIMQDENLHREFNALMAKRYGGFTVEEAHAVATKAFNIECDHIRWILKDPIGPSDRDSVVTREEALAVDAAAGLTVDAVIEYVKTLVDQVLAMADVPPLFNADATLPWMSDMGLDNKENFYETMVTKYSAISTKGAMASASAGGAPPAEYDNDF